MGTLHTTFANLEKDDAEIVYWFDGIRDERFDAVDSSSISPTYNQTTKASPTRMSVELLSYFNHQMLSNAEPVDALQFDLLDFWLKKKWRYPIISTIAKDLLTPPASTVISESAFSESK